MSKVTSGGGGEFMMLDYAVINQQILIDLMYDHGFQIMWIKLYLP